MLTTDTFAVASGSTVTDLWAFLVLSSTPTDQTPDHEVIIQNNGSGALRVGSVGAVSTNNGVKVSAGETFRMHVSNPNRLGFVGDGGAAASSITVIVQVR